MLSVLFNILIFLLCTINLSHANQNLIFEKETIDIAVADSTQFEVTGKYWFKGAGAIDRYPLLYPFPVDTNIQFPHRIILEDTIQYMASIEEVKSKAIHIPIHCQQPEQCTFKVRYLQKVKQKKGKYILLTTQSWERPLESGVYTLTSKLKMPLSYISYPVDTVMTHGNKMVYVFKRENFMPDRDIDFEW